MSWKIRSSHTQPVAAGTVVRLSTPNPSASAGAVSYVWTITGPRSGDVTPITGGPTFDWDTTGLRAGAYDVTCTVAPYAQNAAPSVVAKAEEPIGDGGEEVGGIGPTASTYRTEPLESGGESTDASDFGGDDGQVWGTSDPFRLRIEAGPALQEGALPVSLQRTALVPTVDQVLWVIIRNRTNAVNFASYKRFIDSVMCGGPEAQKVWADAPTRPLMFRGSNAYDILKQATEAFLMQEVGVIGSAQADMLHSLDPVAALDDVRRQLADPSTSEGLLLDERNRLGRNVDFGELDAMRRSYYKVVQDEGMLPYYRLIVDRLSDVPLKDKLEIADGAYGILKSRLSSPLAIELIWSYWHEEGMLVQALNAILARFQNRRLVTGHDPLARLDLDPLRPMSNIFWGFAQDEINRLTVRRRAYEYDHEYGLRLIGKAVPTYNTTDSRRKFLQAFHNLLLLCHVFFKEDDDTTVIADGFPLLNALRETHLILAEGAHNQFGDLPSTARAEMLIMQWMLARPEMREFLGGRVMVPYEEPWMDRVDSVKQMYGWTDVSITHFRDMGVYGEQILLSIRYGNWSVINDPQQAANWARYWRPEIQRYTHAYRSATGADLTQDADPTLPGRYLQQRAAGHSAR